MTYDELKTALRGYVHRGDAASTANEANALELARTMLGRSFFPEVAFAQAVDLPLVNGRGDLPVDFGQADVVVSKSAPTGDLLYCTPREFVRRSAQGTEGQHFTITGTRLYTHPSRLLVNLNYYRTPAVITGAETNWLSETFPDVWLWAALAEQHRYVEDFDAAEVATEQWQSLAVKAADDTRANRGGGALRMVSRR